ncbi:MAG: WD40/YVTN/BNR-like repeat-containing protein [Thermoanaerobaculia bacterium]
MTVSRRGILSLVLALVAISGSAATPPFDSRSFSDLRWRCIGPFRGGRVLAASGVPGEPDHFYFGAVGGGVWESRNAGRTWTPIFDSQPVASIGAIAIAPSDPRVIYVGSGEADMRSDISYGNGMYGSTDGGRSWAHSGLEDSQQIGRIVVDPRNAKTALVAVLGHAYAPSSTRGVYRTTDGGATWTRVLFKDDDTGAIDIAIDPANPDVLLAALWQTRRPPWNTYPPSYGPGSGLYRSVDGGLHWAPIVGNGFPSAGLGRVGLAFSLSRPECVYALVDATEGGVYRSLDGGRSWTRRSGDPRVWQRGWYFGGISVDPKDADIVFACDTAMYRSSDGGATFLPFKGAPGGDDYHRLWIDPTDSRRMMLAADQGAAVTVDGGKTWSSWYNQPTAQLYHVATDGRFPYRVYGAQQDSGAAMVPSQSDWQGVLPFDWRPVAVGYENGSIAPDPVDPRTVFGANVTRFDADSLQNRDVDPGRAYPDRYRHTWTLPLVFSRRNPRVLYFANQRLFRSETAGNHWEPISPDLSRADPGAPANLDPATAKDSPVAGPRRGVIYTIAPSYLRDGEIWCGTDDGLVWRTPNEGKKWINVTPKGLTPWSKIAMIEASRFDADTAYAAIDRHRLDDFHPHIARTRDGGRSWNEVVSGLPAGAFVHVVREDPVRRGLLYAGTETGVFVSFDDAEHWQPLQQNLPACSVRDLEVHGSDLVAGTHGRSIWILDDVSPLRQFTAEVSASRAWLFQPAPAVRLHPAQFQGTPVPKDEPIGENPPRGAILDYWLGRGGAAPVVVEISSGSELLRRFSSSDPPRPPNQTRIVVTPDWMPSPPLPSPEEGFHRFVWDLHTATIPDLSESEDFRNEGLWVPPGRYTVRLTAGGVSVDRELEIRRDPRVRATDEDLRANFELSRKLEKERVRVAAAEREARALRGTLSALVAGGGRPAADAAKARAELDRIAGTADELTLSSTGGDPDSLQGASWSLRGLAAGLESADAGPSVDDLRGFELRVAAARRVLGVWERFRASRTFR